MERNVYVTFLASAFRTLRFGGDAHAIGMALQVNTLLDAGGFRVAADGRFSVDPARIKDAVRASAAEESWPCRRPAIAPRPPRWCAPAHVPVPR